MPFFCFTEIFPILVFASGYQLSVLFRSAYVFHYFQAVEIMLHLVVWVDYHAPFVPFAYWFQESVLFFSSDQIVKGSQGSVALFAHFCIGMFLVIEDLIFQANSRSLIVFCKGDK